VTRKGNSHIILILFTIGIMVFLLSPLVPVVVSSFSRLPVVVFPPRGFTLSWYANIPAKYWGSLGTSLMVAALTATCVCLLGVPATFALVRGSYPGRNWVQALLMSPLQVPYVVSGIVFMQFFFSVQQMIGVSLLGSITGLTLSHTILALPFMVSTLGPVLQRFHGSLEEAALSLGASRVRTMQRITLPVIAPGIFAGAMFAFICSFGDVAATVFLVSSRTMTLPVEMFYAMEFDMKPSVLAISTLVIIISAAMIRLIYRFTETEGGGGGERLA